MKRPKTLYGLLALGMIYHGFEIPFSLGFGLEGLNYPMTIVPTSLYIEWVFDFLFLFRFIVYEHNKTLGIENSFSEREMKYEWILVFPVDLMFLILFGSSKMWIYILRLPKLWRLIDLPKLLRDAYFGRAFTEEESLTDWAATHPLQRLSSGIVRLLWCFILLVALSHWSACLLVFFTRVTCEDDLSLCTAETSWAVADQQHLGISTFRRYIRAIYFTMVALVTTGFGDIVPQSSMETCILIIIMLTGMCVSSYIIASFSFIFSNLNEAATTFHRRKDTMQVFMKINNFDGLLKTKVNGYFAYCWATQHGMNEESILESLPAHLKKEVTDELNGVSVHNVVMFKQTERSFINTIIHTMMQLVYSPQDTIVRQGHQDPSMFIVSAGRVGVLFFSTTSLSAAKRYSTFSLSEEEKKKPSKTGRQENRRIRFELFPGESFCESRVLTVTSREKPDGYLGFNVCCHIAITYCQLLQLSQKDFLRALKKCFPDTWRAQRESMRRIIHVSARSLGKANRILGRNAFSVPKATSSTAASVRSQPRSNNRSHREDTEVQKTQKHHVSRSSIDIACDSSASTPTESGQNAAQESIFRPHGPFQMYWNIVCFILLLIQSIAVPFQIGFSPHLITGDFMVPFIFDRFCDVFYICDMILRGRYFAFIMTENLQPIRKHRSEDIWSNYRSSYGFMLDLFATLPLDFIGFLVMGDNEMVFFRFFKALRCFRITEYFSHVQLLLRKSFGASMDTSKATILTLVYMMGMVVHTGGCIWYFLGSPRTEEDAKYYLQSTFDSKPSYEQCLDYQKLEMTMAVDAKEEGAVRCTWMTLDGILDDKLELGTKYFRATYSAVITTTTVGYGDIRPCTTTETIFSFLWVFVSSLIYYAAIGAGATAISNMRKPRNDFDTMRTTLNSFLLHHHILRGLRFQVQRFIMYKWKFQQGVQDEELMQFLPKQLRQEIRSYGNISYFIRNDLFLEVPKLASREFPNALEFMEAIAMKLVHHVWLEGKYIARSGEVGGRMFTLREGYVEIIDCSWGKDQRSSSPSPFFAVHLLSEGMSYGAETLLSTASNDEVLRVDVRAVTFCDVTELHRSTYLEILEDFPELGEIVEEYAKERVRIQKESVTNVQNNLHRLQRTKGAIFLGNEATPATTIFIEPKLDAYIMVPDTFTRELWIALTGCMILVTLLSIPYRIAFNSDFFGAHTWVIPEIILLVDAFLRYSNTAVIRKGLLLTDREKLRKLYVQNRLFYDICFLFPSPILGVVAVHLGLIPPWLWKWAFMPRLLGFPRLSQYYDSVTRYIAIESGSINVNYFKLLRIFMLVTFAAHYCGLTFYKVSENNLKCGAYTLPEGGVVDDSLLCNPTPVGFSHTYANWILDDGLVSIVDSGKEKIINYASVLESWTRSFYWALSTLTVVCYGDITPSNMIETLVTFFVVISGVAIMSTLVGDMAGILISLNQTKDSFERKVNAFGQFASEKNVPRDIREQVLAYYEYVLCRTKGLQEEKILSELPFSLRMELSRQIFLPYISYIPELTFVHTPEDTPGVLGTLAQSLKLKLCLPDEEIIREGDRGDHLFILKFGRVEVSTHASRMTLAVIENFSTVSHRNGRENDESGSLERTKSFQKDKRGSNGVIRRGSAKIAEAIKNRKRKRRRRSSVSWVEMENAEAKSIAAAVASLRSDAPRTFGEIAFFDQTRRRTATVRAIGYVELLTLSYHDWAKVTPNAGKCDITQKFVNKRADAYARAREAITGNMKRMYKPVKEIAVDDDEDLDEEAEDSFDMSRDLSSRFGSRLMSTVTQVEAFDESDGSAAATDEKSMSLNPLKLFRKRSVHSTNNKIVPVTSDSASAPDLARSKILELPAKRYCSLHRKIVESNDLEAQVAVARRKSVRRPINSGGGGGGSSRMRSGILNTARSLGSKIYSRQRDSCYTPFRKDSMIKNKLIYEARNASSRYSSRESELLTAREEQQVPVVRSNPTASQHRNSFSALRSTLLVAKFGKLMRSRVSSTASSSSDDEESSSLADTCRTNSSESSTSIRTTMLVARFGTLMKSRLQQQDDKETPELIELLAKHNVPEFILHEKRLRPWVDTIRINPYAHPDSKFRMIWHMIYLLAILYNLLMVPFRMAYQTIDSPDLDLWIFWWIIFDYIVDFIFLLDVALHATFFAYRQNGELYGARDEIFSRYVKSSKGRVSLFINLPLDRLTSPTVIVSLWRINKLFASVHVPELFAQMEKYIVHVRRTKIRLSTIRTIRFLGVILYIAHWISCVWYLAGYYYNGEGTAWISVPGMLDTAYNLEHNPPELARQYIRSTYFAIVSLTTVGYGDIASNNAIETLINIVIVILSAACFAALAGLMEMRISDLDRHNTYFERTMGLFRQFAKSRNISKSTQHKVLCNYGFAWNQMNTIDEQNVLQDLPLPLQKQLLVFMNKELITNVPLLRSVKAELVYELAASLKLELFFSGDTIIQEGTNGTDMYFIYSGTCSVSKSGIFLSALEKGQVFGEMGLLGSALRNATVTAVTRCQLYVLTRKSFNEALSQFPFLRPKIEADWMDLYGFPSSD